MKLKLCACAENAYDSNVLLQSKATRSFPLSRSLDKGTGEECSGAASEMFFHGILIEKCQSQQEANRDICLVS